MWPFPDCARKTLLPSTYSRGLRRPRESRAFQLWNTLLLSHIWSHTQLGYFSCATISTQIDTQFGTAILIVAECYLILYTILVFAVHQLLVYQRLFRRRTKSNLNRRLLDREPAVRVSHPRILERMTLQHLQSVCGVTSQIFKILEISSIFSTT
jgi:hypothetical protein